MPSAPHSRRVAAIVLGASAGGVEALSELLPALEPSCGVPVFVVVHLPRERRSLLAEIFTPKCRLPVLEAEDKLPIRPNMIYFAPPDYHMLLDAGPQIALSSDALVHYSRPSLDVLFESAVDVYGADLLGIVLSGANADGAAGLRAIERANGLTFVQQPESAVSSAMPQAALAAAPTSPALELRHLALLLKKVRAGALTLEAAS